jgi:uncharacterized membrane protein
VIWVAALIPVEVQPARLAREFQDGSATADRYWRLSGLWAIFGSIATLPLLANLYLMVFKPD